MTNEPGTSPAQRRVLRHLAIDLDRVGELPPLLFSVRAVGMEELDALAELMADAYTGSVSPEWADHEAARREIHRILTTFDGPVVPEACLAAFDGSRPVSACLCRNARGQGCISYLMTVRAYQDRGLGRAVLTPSLAKLKERGFRRAFLDVAAGNAPAEHLYQSLGFVEEWSLPL